MQKKTGKVILAAVLAVMLCMAVIPRAIAYAQGEVDTGKKCSLTIYPGEAELENAVVTVELYQVAEVTQDGKYISKSGFSDLNFGSISSEHSAADLEQLAEEAAALVSGTADAVVTISNGSGSVYGLGTGIYLVSAKDVVMEEYTYVFSPYLLSLPNNVLYEDGTTRLAYENVQISLKPEKDSRYGSLEIIKTLRSFDTTFGTPLFIFDVEAVKDGKNVYSNVLSLSFDGAGQKSVVVEDLPAGAVVTVTEVYSGACYQITTDTQVTATIIADETAQASFTNVYDETLTYGSGVVNHFDYDGNGHWRWEQLTGNE